MEKIICYQFEDINFTHAGVQEQVQTERARFRAIDPKPQFSHGRPRKHREAKLRNKRQGQRHLALNLCTFFNVTFRKLYGIKIKTVEVDRDGLLSIFYRYFSLAVLTT